jgi:hypothetical protein
MGRALWGPIVCIYDSLDCQHKLLALDITDRSAISCFRSAGFIETHDDGGEENGGEWIARTLLATDAENVVLAVFRMYAWEMCEHFTQSSGRCVTQSVGCFPYLSSLNMPSRELAQATSQCKSTNS